MLLREVEYAKPKSVAEAVDLLAANDGARALAGGQTLINVMKARAASPDMLVDINGLAELRGIELAGDGTLTIGAMATYTDIVRRPRRRRGRSSARSARRSRTFRCGTADDRRQRLLERSDEPLAAAHGRVRGDDDDSRRGAESAKCRRRFFSACT